MEICRLVYISESTGKMADSDLESLIAQCETRNESLGISGLLLSSGGHFIQVLEGDWIRVTSLYTRICTDPRHDQVQKLMEKPADRRLFPDWGMKLVAPKKTAILDRDRIAKTLVRLRLAKTSDPASEAMALLQEFQAQLTAEEA